MPQQRDESYLRSLYELLMLEDITEYESPAVRDHLSNERTFLAWLRTGLTMVGVGIGIEKLALIHIFSGILGTFFILIGLIIFIYAVYRYFGTMVNLQNRRFEPNKQGIMAILTLTFLVSLATLITLSITWGFEDLSAKNSGEEFEVGEERLLELGREVQKILEERGEGTAESVDVGTLVGWGLRVRERVQAGDIII
mmetsp:Transcript_37259/g.58679  ORF Transcript_37259/g.58679 Transcript_37259/m.58679 type:complete len:197 (-) Transcript_37259:80-670(-)